MRIKTTLAALAGGMLVSSAGAGFAMSGGGSALASSDASLTATIAANLNAATNAFDQAQSLLSCANGLSGELRAASAGVLYAQGAGDLDSAAVQVQSLARANWGDATGPLLQVASETRHLVGEMAVKAHGDAAAAAAARPALEHAVSTEIATARTHASAESTTVIGEARQAGAALSAMFASHPALPAEVSAGGTTNVAAGVSAPRSASVAVGEGPGSATASANLGRGADASSSASWSGTPPQPDPQPASVEASGSGSASVSTSSPAPAGGAPSAEPQPAPNQPAPTTTTTDSQPSNGPSSDPSGGGTSASAELSVSGSLSAG
jgi:hypothetical protein